MPEIDNIGNGSTGFFDASTENIESLNRIAGGEVSAVGSSRLTVRGSANSTKIYKYPIFIDRGKQNSKVEEIARECIRFTVVKQGGVSFKSKDAENLRKGALGQANQRIQGEIDKESNSLRTRLGNVPIEEQASVIANSNRRVNDLRGERARVEAGDIGPVQAGDLFNRQTATTIKTVFGRAREEEQFLEHCFLYMPTSVVFSEGATWGQESLGAMGNATKELIRGKGDIGKILSDFGTGIVPNLAKAAAIGVGGAIAGAFGAIATAVGGGGVSTGVGLGTRIAQNPYEEQLFTGVPFRVFNFNFEFIATSYREYQEVQKIITMFRAHSRPTFAIESGNEGSLNESLYSYPNEFAIDFLHLDEDDTYKTNNNLPRLHNCVLTNITTNFAPDGWQAHEDGEPVTIVVQLAFTEVKKNTRVDVERGY